MVQGVFEAAFRGEFDDSFALTRLVHVRVRDLASFAEVVFQVLSKLALVNHQISGK